MENIMVTKESLYLVAEYRATTPVPQYVVPETEEEHDILIEFIAGLELVSDSPLLDAPPISLELVATAALTATMMNFAANFMGNRPAGERETHIAFTCLDDGAFISLNDDMKQGDVVTGYMSYLPLTHAGVKESTAVFSKVLKDPDTLIMAFKAAISAMEIVKEVEKQAKIDVLQYEADKTSMDKLLEDISVIDTVGTDVGNNSTE
jgi:hypothetical protein